MCFRNLALALFSNCLLNFHLFFFAEGLVENLDEVYSFCEVSSFEDSDDEPLSISESSADESSSLSLSDSSEDKLYILSFCNLGHNIFRLFDVLPNFSFTTSETNRGY